jgi:hypothetical protein
MANKIIDQIKEINAYLEKNNAQEHQKFFN